MKNKYFCVAVIILTFCLFSSSAFAKINKDLQSVVKGNSDFGFDLYQELKGEEGNLFFSPYSISTALAMTYAGARGETEKQMAQVLHFPLTQESLHPAFSKLQSDLNAIQNKGDVQISIANSLWAQESYKFLDSFIELNKKYYDAGLYFVDFIKKREAARKKINDWVEKKTHDKIKELIKPPMLTIDTRLVLCNAIYFKGNWLSQFDKEKTYNRDFYVSPDTTMLVPMMYQQTRLKYKYFEQFCALELPYEGNDLSMIIFLPNEDDGLLEFEDHLTADSVHVWIDELMKVDEGLVMVNMPKFKTVSEFELSRTLYDMGMPDAFSLPPADFSGMTGTKDLFISKVIHKAYVEVNEEGTEAAAATAVVMMKSVAMKPLEFKADHPFIFLIRENQTGSILFIGRIVDPTK